MIALPLNPHVHDLLMRLNQRHSFGVEWVGVAEFADIPMVEREFALNEGFVKERGFGNVRQYRLTQVGKDALAAITDQMLQQIQVNPDALEDIDVPEVVEPEFSVSVYGETLGVDREVPADDAVGTSHVSSVKSVKPCCEPGCDQPRYLSYNRCQPHQQAVWRSKQTEQRDADRPNRKRRPLREVQPNTAIVEPPIADDDTQPDIIPVTESLPPLSVHGEGPGEGLPVTPPALTRLVQSTARAAVRFILIAKGGY